MTIELTSKDTAEAIAARLRADDPEWQYIVRESKTSLAHPLNHSRTGNYIIAVYDDSGAIGKRYTRQDLIGTPFCIAVDYESKEDNCVTIRHRDSMEEERVPISELKERIGKEVAIDRILEAI